ncbi:thymidylate synthase [Planctomycetaceae bacterium SCGC AG-212-F19]|nr:thymidylate synthase [Planctomycetaceae bacterium SCGC AG-212-F19]
MIGESTIVVAAKEQISANLDGEVVLLNLATGTYHGLNGVGSRIWQMVQDPRTVSDVRDALVAEYDVESAQCQADLLALLNELEVRGLIEIKGPTA